MYKARLSGFPAEIIGQPTHYGMVFAKQIDPDHAPDELQCPCCDVPVYAVGAKLGVGGGDASGNNYFATYPGYADKHQQDCPYVGATADFSTNKGISAALKDECSGLVLNINFLHSGDKKLSKPKKRGVRSYETWMGDGVDYHSYAVGEVGDYFKAVRRILDKQGLDYLRHNVRVNYRGHLMTTNEFSACGPISGLDGLLSQVEHKRVLASQVRNDFNFYQLCPALLPVAMDKTYWAYAEGKLPRLEYDISENISEIFSECIQLRHIVLFENAMRADRRGFGVNEDDAKTVIQQIQEDDPAFLYVVATPILKLSSGFNAYAAAKGLRDQQSMFEVYWKVRSLNAVLDPQTLKGFGVDHPHYFDPEGYFAENPDLPFLGKG